MKLALKNIFSKGMKELPETFMQKYTSHGFSICKYPHFSQMEEELKLFLSSTNGHFLHDITSIIS